MILTYFVTVIHVIVCLFLIGVVLLQQGKSADLAGAFGGQGSQTAFGPRGAANLLTKLTTWSAVVFMITSISLFVLIGKHSGPHSVLDGIKGAPQTQTQTTTPAK
jgi:preprotein translocase subunit SecG